MPILVMFLIYVVLMSAAVLILVSKDAHQGLKWFGAMSLIGLTLALIVGLLIKFATKAGYINF